MNKLAYYLRIENLANYIAKNLSTPMVDENGDTNLVVDISEVHRTAFEWGFHDDDMPDIIKSVEERVFINYKE